MKIRLDLQSLQGALETISKIAPPASGNVAIVVSKQRMKVQSISELSRCLVTVPAEVEGDGEIAVPVEALRAAIKGRSILLLTYANATLVISAPNGYTAEIATVDVIPVDEEEEQETIEWKLTTDQASWLKKALKDVQLKPTAILSSWMPAGVKLTDKGAFVACYDTQHMSWVTSKEVKGTFECVIPVDTMLNIMDVFHKSDFVIHQGKSRMQIRNKMVEVSLSLPVTDELPPLDAVQGKIKEAASAEGQVFRLPKAELQGIMENARAILTKDRAEVIVTADKGVEVLIKTEQGQVKGKLRGEGSGTFKIDYEYLTELIGKAPEELRLKVVGDAFLSSKLANSTLIIALNQ